MIKKALIVVVMLALPIMADAQDNMAELELMGRLCVNEASWNVRDCAAITHIRIRSARSHNRTLADELIALHGRRSLRPDRATNIRRRDNRPWIAQLSALGARPGLWPDTVDWASNGQVGWSQIMTVVAAVIRGEWPDPCRGSPNTWGNRTGDHARALRLGFHQVNCGNTANMFWRM